MARVELVSVAKRWGTTTAVEPLSLDIADGEFLVLLGPSGCGKTTTMRMVAGLEEPSEGEIRIGGRRVNELEPKDRDVAMVFQSYGLYPNMTVYENIAFPLKIRGTPAAEIRPAVLKAAAQVELGDYLDRRPKALSGGQRQRVALARAIVRRPAVFLMDEPLSNLDAKLRGAMRVHLKHLHHALGVTTVYVTHDQIEAMTLADRVVVMSRARVQQVGTPEQIYNDPANLFVAGFVGTPAMNLLHGRLVDGRFEAPGVVLPGFGPRSREGVVLGVRAEDLSVRAGAEGPVRGSVFAVELTGESTLVTLALEGRPGGAGAMQPTPADADTGAPALAGARVAARADKAFRAPMGAPLALHTEASRCFLFDADSGQRIRAEA
jgi:multiple sugar transport system ATP-binding protein